MHSARATLFSMTSFQKLINSAIISEIMLPVDMSCCKINYSLFPVTRPNRILSRLHDRVSNQISATTYNQTPVSQEWKELWSPFLRWLVALVKCWSHTKSKVFAINHVWARDKNVHPSDLCNYQTFVPNFRQLVPSPLKMICGVPD